MVLFKEIILGVDHKSFVRHMHANFKKQGFTWKTLKDLMWNATKAYKETKNRFHLEKIKSISDDAYEWLAKFDARLWCW